MTPGEAADRLGRAIEAAVAARRTALAAGAESMRQACSDAIGRDGGPDGSWPDLGEGTLRNKREAHQLGRISPQDQLYATGQLKASFVVVEQRDADTLVVTSTDPVARYHEQGTAEMPPRPVMAPIAAKMGEDVARRVGQAAADAIQAALEP